MQVSMKEKIFNKIKKSNPSTLKWINEVSGKNKIYIGILIFVQSILGFSSIFYAVILKYVINKAVAGKQEKFFIGIALFAILVLFQIALRAVIRFLEEYTRATLENTFKERLFNNILNQEYEMISSVHSGEWMNRLTSDTVVVADGMAQIIPGVSGMLVKMFGAMAMILILVPAFGLVLIPGGILLITLTYAFRKVLKKLHKKVQEADGNLRVHLQESLSNMLVVIVFGKEKQELLSAVDKMNLHKQARMKKNYFSNICNIGFGGVIQGAYVLGIGICGYGILNSTMSYGTLMAVMQLISQIQSPFANITGYLPKYYAMIASAERLMEREVTDRELIGSIKTLDEINPFYKEKFTGITLEDCTFTYKPLDEKKEGLMPVVLSNVALTVSKGDYVAVTGPSGCGKSTILKLLMCVLPLEKGKRMLTTIDGRVLLTSEYRRLFAYVPQENNLMRGTIREIVAFSDEKEMQDEKKIWESLRIACADEFVKKLSDGIDTLLGERGMGLSEGQMQRIAIARAVFSNNPILMLDESTSALDEKTEAKVLSNLRMLTDKTVLIVTHRNAVLRICNKELQFSEDKATMIVRRNDTI